MLAHKRKQIIKELVDKYRIVRVSDLSERFGISDVTIRRDLKELEVEGILKRTHGGAVKASNISAEAALAHMESMMAHEKMLIAQTAFHLIEDNDAIILDSSSTASHLASLIKNGDKKNLTLVTNSFKAVMELYNCDHVELIHIGGVITKNIISSTGTIAENTLKSLRVDKAFIGVNGIDFRNGLTTPSILDSQLKKAMIGAANQAYVLADSTKFNQTYLSIICPASEVDYIITDEHVDEETAYNACSIGINLRIAKDIFR